MEAQTTLAALRNAANPAPAPAMPPVSVGMDTVGGFEALQRIAKLFMSANLVPKDYQNNLPNTFIAVDMAMRLNANPLAVMQSMYVVHGRPGWSAQFLIATLNKSGKFSALKYAFQGEQGKDNWGCRAYATELSTGEKIEGPLITISLAKKEGWYSKKDKYGNETSKWQTMPELMLRYRAAAWFVRAYAPEIAMGLQTADELHDVYDVSVEEVKRPSRAKAKVQPEPEPEAIEAAPEPAPVEAEVVQPEPEPEAAPEPEPAPQDDLLTYIDCPACGQVVERDDCAECRGRKGCPAWD